MLMLTLAVLAATPRPAKPPPAPPPPTSQALLASVRDRVVQVRVTQKTSHTKSSIGSGFFAGPPGTIVTNYHVVSDLVLEPERHDVEVVLGDTTLPAQVVEVDVVHDLARLQVDTLDVSPLPVRVDVPPHGEKLYALGNPLDLGLTLVEGTFNGLRPDAFIEALNYSGSINSGMSGGPAIDQQGRVVGVNVATYGNGLGQLVPASAVTGLLAATPGTGPLLPRMQAQLTAHQKRLADDIVSGTPEHLELGGFSVPSRLRPWLKCWSSSDKATREYRVDRTWQACNMEDGHVYVSDGFRSGAMQVSHQLFTSNGLSALRFSTAAGRSFAADLNLGGANGNAESVTSFRCSTLAVTLAEAPFRGVACLRAHKRFPGLYDVLYRVQSQTENFSALRSDLLLTGFTLEDAQRVATHFFGGYAWKR